LAAAFYTAGRGELLKRVAAFLKSLTARGFLSIKDPELAAEQLVASWFGMSVLRQSPRHGWSAFCGGNCRARPLRRQHAGTRLVDRRRSCRR
jgi:AefR-like transcriptional repressor, C-terminal domain